MVKHRQTKATGILPRVRYRVLERDGKCCILCGRPWYLEIAHYIGSAQGGMGIEQNLVTLCKNCHMEYDNGDYRQIHGQSIRDYLKANYKGWNEKKLVYNKYDWVTENETESTAEN